MNHYVEYIYILYRVNERMNVVIHCSLSMSNIEMVFITYVVTLHDIIDNMI